MQCGAAMGEARAEDICLQPGNVIKTSRCFSLYKKVPKKTGFNRLKEFEHANDSGQGFFSYQE